MDPITIVLLIVAIVIGLASVSSSTDSLPAPHPRTLPARPQAWSRMPRSKPRRSDVKPPWKPRTRPFATSRRWRRRTRSACARCAPPRTASPSARNPSIAASSRWRCRAPALVFAGTGRARARCRRGRECHRAPSRGGPDRGIQPGPRARCGHEPPGGQRGAAGDYPRRGHSRIGRHHSRCRGAREGRGRQEGAR